MSKYRKVVVTGAGGLLGSEFKELARKKSYPSFEIIPLHRSELDICSSQKVEQTIKQFKPDFLINCAAYTQVDQAEREPQQARETNASSVQQLAEICKEHRVKLVHYGTDFVFDGKKKSPYLESDNPSPLNVYGVTKLEGEKLIQSILPRDQYLILRISWPYGKWGKNFIHSLWEISKNRKEIRVVTDQVGVPNPASLLAQKTLDLLEGESGLLHLSCSGSVSRFELISLLLKTVNSSCRVLPATTAEFPSPAQRPPYSALGTEREDLRSKLDLPDWRKAFIDYLQSSL